LCVFSLSAPSVLDPRDPPSFPTRRSSDLVVTLGRRGRGEAGDRVRLGTVEVLGGERAPDLVRVDLAGLALAHRLDDSTELDLQRSEEHTSELQSRENLVCRLLLEKKKANK